MMLVIFQFNNMMGRIMSMSYTSGLTICESDDPEYIYHAVIAASETVDIEMNATEKISSTLVSSPNVILEETKDTVEDITSFELSDIWDISFIRFYQN